MKISRSKIISIISIGMMMFVVVTPTIYAHKNNNVKPLLQIINMTTGDTDPTTEKMLEIINENKIFLNETDEKMKEYYDSHGGLSEYIFDFNTLYQLESIYQQFALLINITNNSSDWQGYIGYIVPQYFYHPERIVYYFWIPHRYINAFCTAMDYNNLVCALWLGADIHYDPFDESSIKTFYCLSTFFRSQYNGYTVSKIEQQGNQDPSDDSGVKITFINLFVPMPFVPEDVIVVPQDYTDTPQLNCQLIKPQSGYIYFKDIEMKRRDILSQAIIIGEFAIKVSPTTNHSLEKVEFYIDGVSVTNDTEAPFSWAWKTLHIARHTITVVARDNEKHLNSIQLTVLKIF
jgi:hypothetical protein